MLALSLFLAALLLATANRVAYRSRRPGPKIVGLSVAFLIGPFFLPIILPPVALLALLLPAALFLWKESSRGPSLFLALSLGAALIAFGIPTLLGYQNERGYVRLRARYPYESLEERLPTPGPSSRGGQLTPEALIRLARLEGEVGSGSSRGLRLRRLHEDAVGLFVNSFGFGVGRMAPTQPTEANLASSLRDGPPPLQPGPRVAPARSHGEWWRPTAGEEGPLGQLHEEGVVDFINPWGFGHVKDRRHVAGFEPHRFGNVPHSWAQWKVQTLDLVGLLLHDEPRVYVSAHLPRMDELRDAPTRPPDPFEAAGLEVIRRGDDLVIARDGDTPRMLGAIRSNVRCIACHGGERGDLLGAFTYTLRPDAQSAPD